MRAIIVCVDYWDYLEITLPRHREHFDEIHVITSSRDEKAQKLCAMLGLTIPLTCHVTDLFYEPGAVFNKWKALEWGLDQMGREGWLCILDADIILPPSFGFREWSYAVEEWEDNIGNLYTPRRRMMTRMDQAIPYDGNWWQFDLHRNEAEFAGYCQIFHASDPALPNPPPWHEVNWRHAGGADSFFQARWKPENKIRPPFECLHLGEAGRNWCGRATAYLDGTKPEEADQRRDRLRKFISGRGRGPTRFDGEKY